MQHHTHVQRSTHIRAASHHMHQQAALAAGPPHMALNLGPLPQPNAAPHQHQQQQAHHLKNIGVGGPTMALHLQQQHHHQLHTPKANYLQLNNRLSHHHQQPHHLMQTQQRGNQQKLHTSSSSQMQKIRQQHQFLNNRNGNNNNSNNNKVNINSHASQQQHMVLQPYQQQNSHHQRNIHQHSGQQGQNTKQQYQQHAVHNLQPSNIINEQPPQQQHVLSPSSNNNTSSVASKQQQHGYGNGGKTSYNNNNSSNNNSAPAAAAPAAMIPKSILQNPNRVHNNNKQHNVSLVLPTDISTHSADASSGSSAVGRGGVGGGNAANLEATNTIENNEAAEASNSVANKNNETITTKAATPPPPPTPVVSAKQATATTTNLAASTTTATTNVPSDTTNTEDSFSDNKENNEPPSPGDIDVLPDDNNILSSVAESNPLSTSKEKTPMCLVNELARLNQISHQYRLTSEKGPAHCKRFTVTLKLGDEEYSAEGYKIKKAQHMAAAEALEKTKYEHPVPKTTRHHEEAGSRPAITPTVELNALAMKLGQPTYYLIDLPPPAGPEMMYGPGPHGPPVPHGAAPLMLPPPHQTNSYMRRHVPPFPRFNHYRNGGVGFPHLNKLIRYPSMPPVLGHNGGGGAGGMPPHPHMPYPPPLTPCRVTLIVGKQKFVGNGRTLQAAKHDAASRALQVIRAQATSQLNEMLQRSMEESDSKSPISLVHEIGVKRNMNVQFKVVRDEGPAHMKNFITACIVGNIVTEGSGNGKKISKKRAAEKMLEELKKLPPLSPTRSPIRRIKMKPIKSKAVAEPAGAERKKRTGGASIKENSGADMVAERGNAISKLQVLMQSRNEPEPIYDLITRSENEPMRRNECVVKASAAGKVARGTGNSVKLAKRNAAQNLLECILNEETAADVTIQAAVPQQTLDSTIGYSGECTEVDESTDAESNRTLSMNKTATTSTALPLVKTSTGQVPGILILRQNKKHAANKNASKYVSTSSTSSVNSMSTKSKDTASIASTTDFSTASTTSTNLTETTTSSSAAIEEPVITTEESRSDVDTSFSSSVSNSSCNNPSLGGGSGLRMKKKLLYLAQVLGFDVDFSDYPKGNHNEFLTIVTLSTSPEQICHGTGATSEESQNDASRNALKILSELDIHNVNSK